MTRRGKQDNFLLGFCRVLKLTIQQQLDIAVALCEAPDENVAAAGVKFLEAKLAEYEALGSAKMSNDTFFALLYLLNTHPV
jgi:hypothetical protein